MEFRKEDTLKYLKSGWFEFLDRPDIVVCTVEKNRLRRTLWRAAYFVLGYSYKFRIFPNRKEALNWVMKEKRVDIAV